MLTENNIKNYTKIVTDASVIIKLFSNEEGSKIVEALIARSMEDNLRLFAPDLLIYEVANALWKSKVYSIEKITAAIETIYNIPLIFFSIDRLSATVALELMLKYNMTFYDATYAGLAKSLNIPLLSADKKGHNQVKEIQILNLL